MRWNNMLRAGTTGAIGVGLFVCAGAQATGLPTNTATTAPSQQTTSQPRRVSLAPAVQTPAIEKVKQEALDAALSPQITPWHRYTVRSGDSLSRIFARAGLSARAWIRVLDLDHTDALSHLQPGDVLEIRKTPGGDLSELRFKLNAIDTLAVNRRDDTLTSDVVQLKTHSRRLIANGTVQGSLSASLAAAGVPARIATQLARIYQYRADLSRHMHPGDRFSVIYDAQYAKDKRISVGPIVAASITTGGQDIKAFRAVGPDGQPGYYDASGRSFEPSFSRHPVNYSRISSPFNPNRMHPILHIRRPHYGVDMAASRGTPIHAAAEGTVKFVGRKSGYGRLVELKHFDGYTSRYGHMYKFASGLHDGEHVSKGQLIGYVGATGEATGPHLHFEIRKNGTPHDPLTMDLPDGRPLTHDALAAFTSRIQPLIAKLDDVPGMPNTLIASNAGLESRSRCTQAGAINAALALAPADALARHSLSDLFCVVAQNNSKA